MPLRVLLVTYGSFGDVHPYLAVALGLKERGHDVALATTVNYREKIESEGIRFHAIPPDLSWLEDDAEARRRAMHLRRGTEFVIRKLIMPGFEASYEALQPLCRAADVVVNHALAYAVPVIAEQHNLSWLSAYLQPTMFLSAYDVPVLPGAPLVRGRWTFWLLKRIMYTASGRWAHPIERLRQRIGLPPSPRHSLLEPWSPHGTMAWYSSVLGAPQRDWPPRSVITGFPFYDRLTAEQRSIDADLEAFLQSGPPPVIFTLGTAAVLDAGDFYAAGAAAARDCGLRVVLLVGRNAVEQYRHLQSADVHVAAYAPYSALLPRGLLTVHQGGIGTTGQALRSGRPMIVVPFSHDQPDNATRVERLGVARVIPRRRYNRNRIAEALRLLVADQHAQDKAAQAGAVVQQEDGVARACEVIGAVHRGAEKSMI